MNKVTNTHSVAEQRLRKEQVKGKLIESFLKEKMAALESGLNDKQACQKILADLKAFTHAKHPIMQLFIQPVQNICDSFS